MAVKEKETQPLLGRNNEVRTRIINRTRRLTIAIFIIIFFFAVLLFAVWDVHRDCKNSVEHIYKLNEVIENEVHKLRFDSYLRDFNKTYSSGEYERRFQNFKVRYLNILVC